LLASHSDERGGSKFFNSPVYLGEIVRSESRNDDTGDSVGSGCCTTAAPPPFRGREQVQANQRALTLVESLFCNSENWRDFREETGQTAYNHDKVRLTGFLVISQK
jgi:hypothetical protein